MSKGDRDDLGQSLKAETIRLGYFKPFGEKSHASSFDASKSNTIGLFRTKIALCKKRLMTDWIFLLETRHSVRHQLCHSSPAESFQPGASGLPSQKYFFLIFLSLTQDSQMKA